MNTHGEHYRIRPITIKISDLYRDETYGVASAVPIDAQAPIHPIQDNVFKVVDYHDGRFEYLVINLTTQYDGILQSNML